MPSIDYSIQLKFLNELNNALTDALQKHGDAGSEKLKELEYMQSEVNRAQRVVNARIGAVETIRSKTSVKTAAQTRFYDETQEKAQPVY